MSSTGFLLSRAMIAAFLIDISAVSITIVAAILHDLSSPNSYPACVSFTKVSSLTRESVFISTRYEGV
jgi:hypothetical protein